MRTTTARTAVAAGTLALVAGLAGCGDDSGSESADPGAGETTTAEPTDGETEDGTEETTEPEETADEPTEGSDGALGTDDFAERVSSAQLEAGSAHLEGSFGGGGQEVELEGDVVVAEDPEEVALQVSVGVPGASQGFSMIVVDQTLYIDQGQGGKYFQVDLDDPSDPLAQQFSAAIQGADPSAQIEALDEALISLEEVGNETVDGVEATQYEATLDSAKLLDEGAFGEQPPGSAGQLPKRLVYDILIGEDDLVRRFDFEVAGIASTFTFSDWGEPVDVQAPPKSKIVQGPTA